ncbi:hypothetical protein GCM10007036_15970 [Alsobacter metallidurans]|uniref:Flagellar hook-length control protein-like C-terminal domain-containing protein n=1 Tax=Alsobacter metallidurans TaxID=340221 RepID=A0A917MJ74_9HYPH|nr:flagellar hook-length control protein FliK [Alsobacter metallidurans]GGH15780.1 hypothetical protein GCM10007036_15970 [Alsobacter metallidurans]
MAVGGVTPLKPALQAAAAEALALEPGAVVAARVAAITQEGLATLITALGPLQVSGAENLQVGANVRLSVLSAGQQPAVQVVLDPASSSVGARPLPPAATVERAPAPPPVLDPLPLATPATALSAALVRADATQAPASQLVSLLRNALADPIVAASLPPAARAAATALVGRALDGGAPIDPVTLQAMAQSSGLFLESRLATGRSPRVADAKSLLLTLAKALVGPVPAVDAPASIDEHTGAAVGERGFQPPRRNPVSDLDLLAAKDIAGSPKPAQGVAAPARSAAEQVDDTTSLVDTVLPLAQALRAAASPIGDARMLAQALRATLAAGGDPIPADVGETPPGSPAPPSHPRDAPPRADQPPRPSSPAMLADTPVTDAPLQRIGEQVEASIDRIRLSQAASLPLNETDSAPQQVRPPGQQGWVFDIPILLPRETANAQVRIRNEGSRGGAAGASAPLWTLEFAIDTSEGGPVHARLALGAQALGVTLWAEKPETRARLEAGADALRFSLVDAAFENPEIAVIPGAPRRPASPPGGRLDQRS